MARLLNALYVLTFHQNYEAMGKQKAHG